MRKILLLYISVLCLGACTPQNPPLDNTSIVRYDRELLNYIHSDDSCEEHNFIARHDKFHPLYCEAILQLPSSTIGDVRTRLSRSDMKALYSASDSLFGDMLTIEKEIQEAFSRYRRLLPSHTLPDSIYTHISGLQQQIINVENIVSISLDHYLGQDYPPYLSLFHTYQLKRKGPEYIVPDLLRVILYTRAPIIVNTSNLLQELIYEGKVIYTLHRLLPDVPIERLLGYTSEELRWCKDNESLMWNKLIQNNVLYTTHRITIEKYMAPAPFTAPFTSMAPGQAGRYIGWRIIEEYMKNASCDMEQLWHTTDEINIIKTANYNGKNNE